MNPGPAGIPQLEYIFSRIVCISVPLGFTVLLVILIIAGIKYLMSAGEPKAISQAHQTVTWGLLGVVFLAISWLILQLIQNFTGIEVTKFTLSSLPGVEGFTGSCWEEAPISKYDPPKPLNSQVSATNPVADNVNKSTTTTKPAVPASGLCIPTDPNYRGFLLNILSKDSVDLQRPYLLEHNIDIPDCSLVNGTTTNKYYSCSFDCKKITNSLIKTNMQTTDLNIYVLDVLLQQMGATRKGEPISPQNPFSKADITKVLEGVKSAYPNILTTNLMEHSVEDNLYVGRCGDPVIEQQLAANTFGLPPQEERQMSTFTSVSLWGKFPKDFSPVSKIVNANEARNIGQKLIHQTLKDKGLIDSSTTFEGDAASVAYKFSCPDADYYLLNPYTGINF